MEQVSWIGLKLLLWIGPEGLELGLFVALVSAAIPFFYWYKLDEIEGLSFLQVFLLFLISRMLDFTTFLWSVRLWGNQAELNLLYRFLIQSLSHGSSAFIVQVSGLVIFLIYAWLFYIFWGKRASLAYLAAVTVGSLVGFFSNVFFAFYLGPILALSA